MLDDAARGCADGGGLAQTPTRSDGYEMEALCRSPIGAIACAVVVSRRLLIEATWPTHPDDPYSQWGGGFL